MGKFADNLQELLANEPDLAAGGAAGSAEDTVGAAADAAEEAADAGPRRIDSKEAEAVDLLDAAGAPVFKRLLPVAGVVAALVILRKLFSRKGA